MTPKTVLIVEDQEDEVALIRHAFAEIGSSHKLIVVKSGSEAVDCLFGTGDFAGRGEKADLILLDLKLPRMDGLAVLRRMRLYESLRKMRVVVLTSSTDQKDLAEAEALGVDLYMQKPLDFDLFVEVIRRVDALLNAPA